MYGRVQQSMEMNLLTVSRQAKTLLDELDTLERYEHLLLSVI
jgi:hypothetical protein